MKGAPLLLFLVVNVLLISGCATNSIESRRSERLSAYTALRPDFQQLVDQGQITSGMSADAVYIAWGKPSEVVQGQSTDRPTETWRYYGTRAQPYQYWDYGPFHTPSRGFHHRYESDYYDYNYPLPHLETDYKPQRYLRAEVNFHNGIVRDWTVLEAGQRTSR